VHAHHTDLVVVVGDLPTVVLQTLQVQQKAWKSKIFGKVAWFYL
jgi:hypothetical protein